MIGKLLKNLFDSGINFGRSKIPLIDRVGSGAQDSYQEAMLQKGLLLLQKVDIAGAILSFSEMTQTYPFDHRGFVNLGVAYLQLGNHEFSLKSLEYARKLAPASPEAAINYALTLRALGQSAYAIEILNTFIRDMGPNVEVGCTLANFIGEIEGTNAAIDYLTKLCNLLTRDSRLYVTLSDHLARDGRYDEAEALLLKAIDLDTNNPSAHLLLGRLLRQRLDIIGAEKSFLRALQLTPLSAEVQLNLSLIHLTQKRYDTGWEGYEKRLFTSEKPLLFPNIPLWNREETSPQHLLVVAEQGLGDEIMFASCFPALSQEVEQVTVLCDERLANLFRCSFSSFDVIAIDRRKTNLRCLENKPGITRQIPIGSLPQRYRRSSEAFSHTAQYLFANPLSRADWFMRLKAHSEKPIIGITWRGGIDQTGRQYRTIPLQYLVSTWSHISAHFLVLQYDITSDEMAILKNSKLHMKSCFPEALENLDDTAALIDACDLIISVPTTVIHIAGAMAKPTWILVPPEADWRYGLDESTMDWYISVRIFRKKINSTWESLIQIVGNELVSFLK